jgi:hypothetical protein
VLGLRRDRRQEHRARCVGLTYRFIAGQPLFAEIIASPGRGLTAAQDRHRAFAAGLIMGDQQAQIQQLLDRARKAYSRFDGTKAFCK